jgi:cysteine desulfurase
MGRPIYLDNNSTTQLDPRVAEEMFEFYLSEFGNPSSKTHLFGKLAESGVANGRMQLANLVNCSTDEIIFTSGATEANNLAIKGLAACSDNKEKHIVTTVMEHSSVLETCRYLEYQGYKVSYLPISADGFINPEQFRASITSTTFLASIMLANNEIGTIQPLKECAEIAHQNGVLVHTDATQVVGKIKVDFEDLGVDFMSLSAHKFYGPKGVGALCIKKKTPKIRIMPLIHGGKHELGLRSGTLNAPGIVGLGKASEIASKEMEEEIIRITFLRDKLYKVLCNKLGSVIVNGSLQNRIPGNLNISFPGINGENLIAYLQEKVALSSGSACSSLNMEPSHVLTALGINSQCIKSSIRIGIGRFNTEKDIDEVCQFLIGAVSNREVLV